MVPNCPDRIIPAILIVVDKLNTDEAGYAGERDTAAPRDRHAEMSSIPLYRGTICLTCGNQTRFLCHPRTLHVFPGQSDRWGLRGSNPRPASADPIGEDLNSEAKVFCSWRCHRDLWHLPRISLGTLGGLRRAIDGDGV
jgi:hypothetical protein